MTEVFVYDKEALYNNLPEHYMDQYLSYFDMAHYQKKFGDKTKGFRIKYAKEHPVTFAYYMLGVKIRPYQAFAIDCVLSQQNTAFCWARRLGKSMVLSLVAFWLTFFNLAAKNSIDNFTEIGLVSKEGDAAKKLLSNIRQMIYLGDQYMRKFIQGKPEREAAYSNYFSKHIGEPDNKEQLTWDNRSIIRSLPPTKKVRQYGFSILFIDEIAFLDTKKEGMTPEVFYTTNCKPTVADTNGKIVISSTPNGKQNLFFKLFDPEDNGTSDFARIWFQWEIANGDTDEELKYVQWVKGERIQAEKQGNFNLFKQEFEADFTQVKNNFFEFDDIEAYFNPGLAQHYEWNKTPCSIGFDGGISDCQSVLTVKTKYRGKVIRLYHKKLPKGYDINLMFDDGNDDGWKRLCERYDVQWIVPDDCAQLDSHIKMLLRLGYPTVPYSFKSVNDKNRAFYTYRSMLVENRNIPRMESYPDEELRTELLNIQEQRLTRNWSIHKSPSGSDDMVDSDVYATIPFFEEDTGSFGFADMDDAKYNDLNNNRYITQSFDITTKEFRKDKDWDNMMIKNRGVLKNL